MGVFYETPCIRVGGGPKTWVIRFWGDLGSYANLGGSIRFAITFSWFMRYTAALCAWKVLVVLVGRQERVWQAVMILLVYQWNLWYDVLFERMI